MIKREALPSYHFEVNTDGVIKDPAEMKLRDYTINGSCGKNLIQYPYTTITPETSYTSNGVTFTDNGDGTFTVNGTCDENNPARFIFFSMNDVSHISLDKKYTLSGSTATGRAAVYMRAAKDGKWVHEFWNSGGNPTVCDFSQYDFNSLHFTLYVAAGVTVDNATVKPMLELGEEATEWEPYKSVGDACKNMIEWSNYQTIFPVESRDSITNTYNGDGTFTVNGTTASAADSVGFLASYREPFANNPYSVSLDKNKKYVLSGSTDKITVVFSTKTENNKYSYIRVPVGEEIIIDPSEWNFYEIYWVIYGEISGKGVILDNEIIRPMFREAGYKIPIKNSGKNLIPYPYPNIKLENGITFTDNGDGSITLNGTVPEEKTGSFTFSHYDNVSYDTGIPVDGTYTLSMKRVSGSYTTDGEENTDYIQPYVDGKAQGVVRYDGKNTYEWHGYVTLTRLYIRPGATYDNFTISVQLEKGDTATEHEEYREPSETAISLSEPLGSGETIKMREEGLPDIQLFEGTNILTVETEVAPESAEYQYYTY